jgi:AcrR family transcriptional regulator
LSIVEGFLYYSNHMTTPIAAPPDAESRAPRAPQQERGQRRVEQILDAAESVFAELGVDGTSMQLIADRAGSSVGSLYHFFPNKDAIVDALGARYAESIRLTNEEAMPLEMAHLPAEELFERVLSAQVRFIEQTPAFDAVHQAVQRNCPAINDALNQALVGHVGKFLALRYPHATELQRAASAMVSVTMVHGVVELASRLQSPHREAVLRESKAMLVAHFGTYDSART